MKCMIPVLALATLAIGPVADVPDSEVAMTIPDTALQLRVQYRQLTPELQSFREIDGMAEKDLHQLQVQSLFAQGGSFETDVWLKLGDQEIEPGLYPFGFTVGTAGQMNFFLVDGQRAIPLSGTSIEPGWESPRLLMQLVYVKRNEAHLVWHLKQYAGRFVIGLGSHEVRAPDEDTAPDR